MGREILLKGDTINGKFLYEIEDVSGTGASCIVYKAWYKEDNNSEPHWVQLKELYPYDIGLFRDTSNNLICKTEEDKKKFDEYKKIFEASNNMLVKLNRLTDSTPCEIQSFPYNGTKYSIVAYSNGKQYSDKELQKMELNKLLGIIESLAISVNRLHEEGYLHLDIKPDNFLINDIGSAILFDVDSVVPVDEIKYRNGISYSKKWAAPEMKQAAKKSDYKDISCKSDIFSIGVILFEAIMSRDFLPMETVSYNRNWDVENSIKLREEKQNRKVNINPKFYHKIKEIFEKTLDRNPSKRYNSAQELYDNLDKARDLLKENPWIIPSFRTVTPQFTGRKNELAKMNSILQKENTVFLHGFGGIGKSELALKYAQVYKDNFDTIVFCKYEDSIKEALLNIRIANYENDSNAMTLRKIAELCDERTLIILDNFDVETDEDDYLDDFINNYHCKKIITTRTDFSGLYKQKQLDVDALEQDDVALLFEKESEWSPETEDEEKTLNEILKLIGYHTYFTVILAKKRKEFSLSIDELKKQTEEMLLKKSGKVTVAKDGKLTTDTVSAIAAKLFDFDSISESQKQILYNLYMLSWRTVSRNDYAKIAGYGMSDKEKDALIDALNDLTRLGWIQHDEKNDDFFLHQIMQEMVKENCKDADNYVNNVVKYYLNQAKLLGEKADKKDQLIEEALKEHRLPFLEWDEKENYVNAKKASEIGCFSNFLFSDSKKNLSIILELIAKINGLVSSKLVGNIDEYCCSLECPPELHKQWIEIFCEKPYECCRIEHARLCVSFYEKTGICKESSWNAKRDYWSLVKDYIAHEKFYLLNEGAGPEEVKLNEYELKLIDGVEEIKDALNEEEIDVFETFKKNPEYELVLDHYGSKAEADVVKKYIERINNSTYEQDEIKKDIAAEEELTLRDKDFLLIFATAKKKGFVEVYQEILANNEVDEDEKIDRLGALGAANYFAIENYLKKQGNDNLEDYGKFLILIGEKDLNGLYHGRSSALGNLLLGVYLKNKEEFKENLEEILDDVFLEYFFRYLKKEDLLSADFWEGVCEPFTKYKILNVIFPYVLEYIVMFLDKNNAKDLKETFEKDVDEFSFLKLLKKLSHQVYIATKDKHYLELEKEYEEKIHELPGIKGELDYRIKE